MCEGCPDVGPGCWEEVESPTARGRLCVGWGPGDSQSRHLWTEVQVLELLELEKESRGSRKSSRTEILYRRRR